MNRVEGQRHLDARNWCEAEKHLTVALAERRHTSKRRLDLLLGLAQAQRRQAKFADAEQTVDLAIKLANSRDYSLGSRALDALMDIQLDQGKFAEAEQTAREIMELQGSHSKPDHALLSKSSRKAGNRASKSRPQRRSRGGVSAVGDALRESLRPRARGDGQQPGRVGQCCSAKKASIAEAQQHLRRALQIHRGTLGPDSHEATEDLHHLAASLEDSGDIDGAVEEFERLLALRARQVGCNPAETAEAQVRLAVLYLNARRTAPAKELLIQAIGALERKPGPALSQAMEAMARAEEQFGRPGDADAVAEEGLEYRLKRTVQR